MEGTSTLSPARLGRLIGYVLLLLAGTQGRAGEKVETYLIVERPSALVIYDRYQQLLGSRESIALGNFAPFRVLKARDLLGDGITPCFTVDLGGTPYFLLRVEPDQLAGENEAGMVTWMRNAAPLGDSVDLLRSVQIQQPGGRLEHSLPSGERVERVFQSGVRTYIHRAAGTVHYGWVNLEEQQRGRVWSMPVARPVAAAVLTPSLTEGVRSRIEEANRVLAALFANFNSRFHANRPAPQWSIRSSADTLVCSLGGNTVVPGESTRALAREIENVLLGSRFRVDSTPGRITVRPG